MDALRRIARSDPEGTALLSADTAQVERTDWRTLDAQVDAVALHLWSLGVGPGRAVAMLLTPGPAALVLQHAVPRLGGVLVPLNPAWTTREIEGAGQALRGVVGTPQVVVAPDARLREVADLLAPVGVIAHTLPAFSAERGAAPRDGVELVSAECVEALCRAPWGHLSMPTGAVGRPPDLPEDADTPVAVLLTSGTSGRPKPIPLTRGNLEASARGVTERLRLDPADRWLWVLSPAHVGGLALVHRAAEVGAAVLPLSGFDPARVLALAERGAFTHASLVPVQLQRLLDVAEGRGAGGREGTQREGARDGEGSDGRDGTQREGARDGARDDKTQRDGRYDGRDDGRDEKTHGGSGHTAPLGVRCVLIGGAETPPSLLDRALRARWPVALTYGMTEATSQVATAPPDAVRRKPGSVGRPLAGVHVRIAPGGEILVAGASVALLPPMVDQAGRVSEEGRAGARPSAGVYLDRDGVLHTGDLGRIDADGDIWVTGRLSTRIVTGGVTVDPGEVEDALGAHPDIAEVAVVGVPDPEWGERIVAVIVPRDPSGPPLTEDALLVWARPHLAPPKRPRGVRCVDALPRNANGKVDRAALRGLAVSGRPGPADARD